MIRCSFRYLNLTSSALIWNIIAAEEHLPLTIQPSSIEGAGMGVFATLDIPKNSIINVYTGDIGPHHDVRFSDYLFDLGVLTHEGP